MDKCFLIKEYAEKYTLEEKADFNTFQLFFTMIPTEGSFRQCIKILKTEVNWLFWIFMYGTDMKLCLILEKMVKYKSCKHIR
jgi:hypothetical protein